MADKVSRNLREKVAARAKRRFEYCKTPENYAPGYFEVDHILPSTKGGFSKPENLAYTCDGCNNLKSNKTESVDPVSNMLVSLFHPRKNNWNEHFSWSTDSLQICGTSPEGRATIEALQLNRQPLINLRMALFLVGTHPPAD